MGYLEGYGVRGGEEGEGWEERRRMSMLSEDGDSVIVVVTKVIYYINYVFEVGSVMWYLEGYGVRVGEEGEGSGERRGVGTKEKSKEKERGRKKGEGWGERRGLFQKHFVGSMNNVVSGMLFSLSIYLRIVPLCLLLRSFLFLSRNISLLVMYPSYINCSCYSGSIILS